MKRNKNCPKCGSRKIGYLMAQPDSHNEAPTADRRQVSPANQRARAVGHGPKEGFLEFRELIGVLEAYVCTECGFHETYVKNPSIIPWEELQEFRWLNPPAVDDGPFR